MLEDFPGSYSSQLLETMARSGTGTAPAYLLLILAFLPSRESQPGLRLGKHDPDAHAAADSKNNLKKIIKFLDQQIQVLHQKNLMHEPEITEKQGKTFTENMNLVKDVPEPFTYQMLVLNQILQSIRAQSAHRDNSQSTISEQSEISVKELESILNELNKETENQKPLLSSDEMQSSVMENILQELKKYTEQITTSTLITHFKEEWFKIYFINVSEM